MHKKICVVNYVSICPQTVGATFFSLKVIVTVNTWQVTYSVSCANMNYPSDLPAQCGQANSITPFYRSFTSDIKTKEQVAVRTITRTQDFIHACSLPNHRVSVLQPLLIIFNFLCSLQVESMCAMLIIGIYPQLAFPCVAEHFGVRCRSHTGRVSNETSSHRTDCSRKEIRPAGRGLPAEWLWESQLPGWSLGIYPDGLKDFHVTKFSSELRCF